MGTANGDGRHVMGEWPEGWFRDGQDSADAGAASDGGGSGMDGDRTVSIPSNQHPGGQYRVGQYAAGPAGGAAAQRPVPPPGSWPQQPPVDSAAAPAPAMAQDRGRRLRRRPGSTCPFPR